jgi:PleD family two-component response regulator
MSASPTSPDRARILVVDDEASITELVTMALGYAGFEVEVAHSGRAAFRMAEEFRPHVACRGWWSPASLGGSQSTTAAVASGPPSGPPMIP